MDQSDPRTRHAWVGFGATVHGVFRILPAASVESRRVLQCGGSSTSTRLDMRISATASVRMPTIRISQRKAALKESLSHHVIIKLHIARASYMSTDSYTVRTLGACLITLDIFRYFRYWRWDSRAYFTWIILISTKIAPRALFSEAQQRMYSIPAMNSAALTARKFLDFCDDLTDMALNLQNQWNVGHHNACTYIHASRVYADRRDRFPDRRAYTACRLGVTRLDPLPSCSCTGRHNFHRGLCPWSCRSLP